MSGAVPPPAARPLERAARVPRPVCPGSGRCGRVDPAPAPQRAPLRAGVARCGGGGRASPGGGLFRRCEGRLVSGAVPPPAARPLERAARVPQPVCPGCGRCGRVDPAPAPQRAPLRAGVARCGGGGRASPGGVPSAVVRGAWCQALSLPRPPVLWSGQPGFRCACVFVCVLCLAGSGGPASRARSGAPHLFLWPLCLSALLGPLRAGVAPLSLAAAAFPRCPGALFFFFFFFFFFLRAPPLSLAFSGFRPRMPWASALALFALLACRFSALRALVPLSCFPPGCWLLPRGCCPPPPLLFLAVSVAAAWCCVPCCAVRGWVLRCAALLRVVSPGVVLSCAVLRSFGAAACCAVPSGAARRPGALCSAALCFAVFPRAVCSVLCVFCRGAVVRAVVRRSALCCVCPGVLCCAFPVLSALRGAVLRCAGALALCCSCGACCCWRLWCAAVCCAVSCGVPWCGAGSVGPWLFAGGVFRCRCPCLAAWSASLWLVWFAVVPCFPVSCSVVLCCRVVLCCCSLLSLCGTVGACFALLWAVALCCVVLLVGCAVFCPVVVSARCGALSLVPWCRAAAWCRGVLSCRPVGFVSCVGVVL